MARVISIHEYDLVPEADPEAFESALRDARDQGLPELPGLETYYLLRGIKGARTRRYGAVWVYESRAAWEALWGPSDDPLEKPDYPPTWKTWEDEVLASYLREDPDAIRFTSYQEIE